MSLRDPEPTVYNERTALAWQRTALALLACAAIETRLALAPLGAVAVVCVVAAVPVVGWVMLASRQRYRVHSGASPTGRARGGRAPAALAAVTVLIGLTELAALLAGG